jgi:hypothetical protein
LSRAGRPAEFVKKIDRIRFFVKINSLFLSWKTFRLLTFESFKKLPKENNHPRGELGEDSLNLVNLDVGLSGRVVRK